MLFWALATMGLTVVVSSSKIMAPLRDRLPHAGPGERVSVRTFLGSLLRCPMCFGFWAGLFWAALGLRAFTADSVPGLALVAHGFAGVALCWSWHVVLVRLGSQEL